jgi:hypothetical protein
MKVTRFRLFVFSAVTVFALFAVTSCKKSNNSSSGNSVTATFSGTTFTPSATVAEYSASGKEWGITGYTIKSGDTTFLDILLFAPFTVNQPFSTDSTYASLDYLVNGSNGKDYDASQGNGYAILTVTSLDTVGHKIAGTFSGTVYASGSDSLVVTNGKFNTSYIVGP